ESAEADLRSQPANFIRRVRPFREKLEWSLAHELPRLERKDHVMANTEKPAPGGPEGSTGLASEVLTGPPGDAGQADATGAMVDRTTAGASTTTSTSSVEGRGPNLGLGSGQAGGLGLHGDPGVGARAGSTGMMGGAAGSGMPGGFTRGGLTS